MFDRTQGIGGSDAAAVMGLSPWRSRLDVFLEKTHHPHWRPQQVTEAMYWGTLLEDLIANEYAGDAGMDIAHDRDDTQPGMGVVKTRWHPNGVQFGHIDRWAFDKADPDAQNAGILEVKTSSDPDEWVDGVPIYYRVQVQQYMAIVGVEWADVAVLLGSGEPRFRIYREEADPALQMDIEAAVLEFWEQEVKTNTYAGDIEPILRYPAHDESPLLVADEELDGLALRLLALRAEEGDHAAQDAALVKQIQDIVKKAPGATSATWTLSWKAAAPARTVGWEQVATSLWNTLELVRRFTPDPRPDLAPHLAPSLYDTLVSLYTTTSKPSRPFILRARK